MIVLALSAAPATIPSVVARMTIEEKAAQLQSSAPANAGAGLPAYDWWNEGLHGLARNGYATVFPQAIGLAATWDIDLLQRVGDVVSTEARAKFNSKPVSTDRTIYQGLTIWSPNINIFRDPRWGRGQETYGEDPYLTGRLAVFFIRGLQGPDPAHPKVIATPKHLAVHSGPEAGRDGFDVDPSPLDLEATYTPAFRMAVTEGGARSIMCAYNAIHGVPVCALRSLMTDRLRHAWGFDGFTVSDCDAVGNIFAYHHYSINLAGAAAAALRAGTDLNCGTAYSALPAAAKDGLIDVASIDAALSRLLEARRALGIAFSAENPWGTIKADQVATRRHHAVAVEAALKSIVLLKNDHNRLPLTGTPRIAVIGADADDLGVLQGNYHGTAVNPVTPLAGLRAAMGDSKISYAQGSVLAEGAPVIVPETALRANGRPGLQGEYFAGSRVQGKPIAVRQDRRVDFDYNRAAPLPQLRPADFAVRWTGEFVPPGPGAYLLTIDVPPCWKDCTTHDAVRLWIDERAAVEGPLANGRATIVVDGNRTHRIRLEIEHSSADEGIRLLWLPPPEPLLAEAVAKAANADAIISFAGLSPDLEGEALPVRVPGFVGGDRTDISLPEPQRRLLAALRATGKPLILILMSGSAVAVDPGDAEAILAAWYPGEAGGTAIADILLGRENPSGRLPVTFYRSTGDLPAFVDYGMKDRTYRYFAGTPLWAFGHGLSYTRFEYEAATVTERLQAGDTAQLQVAVRNAGTRPGEEVVQAYLVPPRDPATHAATDPVLQRALVAFQRVPIAPGRSRRVALTIDPRAMSSVDGAGRRRVVPGTYRLWIGGGQPEDGPGRWLSFEVLGTAQEVAR